MSLLPSAVRSRLLALGEGVKRADLAQRADRITATYKNKRNSSVAMLNADDALAYAMTRMPATYGATLGAMQELIRATIGFAPESVLDVGCGPGTAAIAALSTWTTVGSVTLMDRNGPFLSLADDLVGSVIADSRKTTVNADVSRHPEFPVADLVMAGYVMVELDSETASAMARKLWAASRQALLLVEPGTPEGFRRLRDIRVTLMADGATVAAPCTHNNTCPMSADNWCRFMARVQRSRDHRMLKQAALAYEDEPYAYLALMRKPGAQRAGYRIVGRSTITKIGISLPACGPRGLETLYASKRETEKNRSFKRLDWGDAVENHNQPVQTGG
jgi:ribosomal protein RSM22 (predicted rRNA methylase)